MSIQYTLDQIQSIIGGKISGDGNTIITGVASIEAATDGNITFIKNDGLIPQVLTTKASAIGVHREIRELKKPQIITENPFLAFIKFMEVIDRERCKRPTGVHPTAIISKEAIPGKRYPWETSCCSL